MNHNPQDLIVANPAEAQQLFILLHDANEQPQDNLCLAQHLQKTFSQAAVIAPATPQALLHQTTDQTALHALLQHWWQATGLDAARTALICQGAPAHNALHAASRKHLCARLFTIGNCLPSATLALPEHTTLHCLCPEDSTDASTIANIAEQLRNTAVDCTLETVPLPCSSNASTIPARIVHLLQSHVPQRLWREAMRHMQADQ